jgi:hypothetical protein
MEIDGGGRRFTADPPELVAAVITLAIETGEAHVMVGPPPRPIAPGGDDPWSSGPARPLASPGWMGGRGPERMAPDQRVPGMGMCTTADPR